MTRLLDTNSIYKTNIFLHTRKKQLENETYKTIPFITAKNTKYLEINLLKDAQDLNIENYKTFLKEIKDNLSNKVFHAHESNDSIVKLPVFPKVVNRFNTIQSKTQVAVCV